MGQQMGFISNGRDAADRIREEGWRAEFLTRKDAMRRAGNRSPGCPERALSEVGGKPRVETCASIGCPSSLATDTTRAVGASEELEVTSVSWLSAV